jgi:hypothetical protein
MGEMPLIKINNGKDIPPPEEMRRATPGWGSTLVRKCAIALAVYGATSAAAFGQGAVQQSGPVTPGHASVWVQDHVIADNSVQPLTSLQILGTGTPFCINDAPTTGPYHALCLGANSLGGGLISYNAYGGAPPLPLQCNINGIVSSCLGGGSTVVGLPGYIDAFRYGVVCGTADSTAGLQGAVNAANAAAGGIVGFNCPITIAGSVTIPSNVRLRGTGSAYYQGQNSGINLWPPALSPAINCTGVSSPCIIANGQGIEIDHINFGNPQPTPPGSGTWTPTVYPFVISTTSTSGWQGLYLHDLTFTSTSNAIDLEGTPDYTAYSGSQIKIRDIWCNACLNTGIRMARIDNPIFIDHVEFTPAWNFSVASMGAYQRANLIGFDMSYVAAPQISNVNFFSAKSAIQVTNNTVTNNFGTLNFAVSAGLFTNTMFNQVCQAMTMPNGNGTIAEFYFVNTYVWGDQSGFQCAKGKALFDVPTNDVRLYMMNAGIAIADTFVDIGCGIPGTGTCPAGTAGGGAFSRFDGVRADKYSAWSAGQPFIRAPSGTELYMGATYPGDIVAAAGGGNIMAPGPDGTQGYASMLGVGGGTNDIEGSVALQGGQGIANNSSGFTAYFTLDHNEAGWTGGCVTGSVAGCTFASTIGNIYLKPTTNVAGSAVMSFGSSSGTAIVNLGTLPTACGGWPSGTLWKNGVVVQVCP